MKRAFDKYATFENIVNFFLVSFLFVALRYNSFTAPFERDEGEYAYAAWLLRHDKFPYELSFLQKPPLIIYTYLIGQFIHPTALWPPRLLAALFAIIVTLFSALIAKRAFGKDVFWPTTWVITPMLVLAYNSPFAANTEIFMLAPLMAFVYLYVLKRETATLKHLFFAGILSSFALLFKPIALFVVVFVFLAWLYESYQKNTSRIDILVKLASAFLGIITVVVFAFLPFIVSGNMDNVWEQVVVYNGYYARSWSFGFGAAFFQIGKILRTYWLPSIISILFFIKSPKRWRFYVGLLFFSFVAIYQSWIGHYYIFLMPFLALIFAYSIVNFSRIKSIKDYKFKKEIILAVIVFSMLWPIRAQFTKSPEELLIWIYGTDNPFFESKTVAQKLQEISELDDYVFVAGSEAEILFYAQRMNSSRFVITYPLIIDTPKRLDYQREAVFELENNPPVAIVLSQKQHSGLWNEQSPRIFIDYLTNLLEEKYELTGGWIWMNGKGFWLENIDTESMQYASLLLYRKKPQTQKQQ